jgi:hypothetical protein
MVKDTEMVENPICNGCGKEIPDIIYASQKEDYLCILCASKHIDTKTLIKQYSKSREKVKKSANSMVATISKERDRLLGLMDKYPFNESNEKLIISRTKAMEDLAEEIRFVFNKHLNADTLIPSEIKR